MSSLPLLPLPPPPHGHDVENLIATAQSGDFSTLYTVIEHPANKLYWNAPHGRYLLRLLATGAANRDRRDVVTYLCEACGVPVNAVRAEEGL